MPREQKNARLRTVVYPRVRPRVCVVGRRMNSLARPGRVERSETTKMQEAYY